MHWFLLILGGIFEMGWAVGLKLSQTMQVKFWGILMAVCSMAISVGLLYFAQKEIPIGTAYIVWAGIGAISTMAVGIIFFGESAAFWRLFFAALILVGVIGIKMQS